MAKHTALALAAVSAMLAVGTGAGYPPPVSVALNYETSCVLEPPNVKGYLRNKSAETYQVNGMATFTFVSAEQSDYGKIQAPAAAVVAPGQNVVVAQTTIPFGVTPSLRCTVNVDSALTPLTK